MKKIKYLLIAVASIISSCKKNDSGSGTTTDTYLPSTVGSNWTYKMVTAGGTPTTGTFTVLKEVRSVPPSSTPTSSTESSL